jgi:hypothetical protein
VLSEPGIKIVPVRLLRTGEDPDHLSGARGGLPGHRAEVYLVNALVDLHSADWASLGWASCGAPAPRWP